MEANKLRVGIQFNIEDSTMALGRKIIHKDIYIRPDHIDVYFTKKELKKLNVDDDNEKIKVLQSHLEKYLKHSGYTNIYTNIDADKLYKIRGLLASKYFTSQNQSIIIEKVTNKGSFIKNFEPKIDRLKVLNLVAKSPIMKVMDKLLKEVAKRDYALDKQLKLELTFDLREEWREVDNLNISLQVEESTPQNPSKI